MAERMGPAMAALQLSCRGNVMRERILRDWIAFAETRGELALLQQLPKTPKGASIDWVRLYEEVVAKGGYRYVCRNKLWPAILSCECLNLDIMPYVLAAHYERFLLAFEEKQLFGRDLPPSTATPTLLKRPSETNSGALEQIATTNELQEAQNVRGTPLPHANKRLKVQRTAQSELGTLHGLVLALDSQLPREVMRAINLLNVLSYGSPSQHSAFAHPTAIPMGEIENELIIDNVPGLLDALYRQLQTCCLLDAQNDSFRDPPAARLRRKLLNMDEEVGQREILDGKALLLLNIVRNLSMVPENEKPLADHEDLVVFFILLLRRLDRHHDIGDHVLDILCNITKRIDFLALHPPSKIELWHPDYNLSSHLWKKESVLPLECLLQSVTALFTKPHQRRSVVLRGCELLCSVTRDVALRPLLSASPSLQSPELLSRVLDLLATCRQDFRYTGIYSRRRLDDGDYAMNDDDDDQTDDEPEDESTKWPAPWESDGLPSGVGMGIVYVTPDGNRSAMSTDNTDEYLKLDHEMRDAALEVLYRLSDCDDAAKLRIARHPHCLPRLAGVLTSCIGRPEAARMAVAALCNLSMNRETFPYFLAIEKDLVLLMCSDRSVADILSNVVADVYGMHAL
ncbi:hypothetical protein Poli38472_001622 [Pythium oligandrum]|uniref:ARID domain-containing protein n=1 Tax=Pythium oligandrum TaxID=41045 RepID=A0A8K1FNJ6_PYTOL|nr:hypothetical protein Poli38472_001622 [Pythium oligandrum]|eukprot:TMW69466.1 hypothetical protein Poli38472_001622 [Pythium oligandrum]